MSERIIFYPEITAFGGGERILLALLKHLRVRTISHRLASYYQAVNLSAYADSPVPVEELCPPRHPFFKARSLCKYLARCQAGGAGTVLLVGIQAALHAGMLRSSDYVLMILDTPSLLSEGKRDPGPWPRLKGAVRSRLNHQFLRRGIRRARSVIVASQYMEREIQQLYGRSSIVTRQGGHVSPQSGLQPRLLRADQRLHLLSVSRLEENKRLDWILEALARPKWRAAFPPPAGHWHFDIVGEGKERERLKKQANELGLGEFVTFHGHVSDARLEDLYEKAAIFLMPARQGYGLPALEALTRGLPVVMHVESGVSEILNNSPWVELIDGGVDGLEAALLNICHRIQSGELARHSLPSFPSESEWAEQIRQICGWH